MGASFTVHLDRRYQLSGVHSAGTTTWTLPIADASINCIVIGEGGGSNCGTVITSGIVVSGKSVSVTGNYGGYESTLGVLFDMNVELSPPYSNTNKDNPDFSTYRQIRWVDLAVHRSAGFTVKSTMTSRSDRSWAYAGPSSGTAEGVGYFRAFCNGNADLQTVSITSTSPKRVCVASVLFEMDVNTRRD